MIPTKLGVQRAPLIIRYRGIFDFDGLYNMIVEWIKARGFWFEETSYKHKVPSALGAEQEIDLTGTRRITHYLVGTINVGIHTWDMTEVEVERNGVKKRLTNARMQINISGTLDGDFDKAFGKGVWKKIGVFFYKYIMIGEWGGFYYDQLYYRLNRLQAAIKDYLDMQTKSHEYSGYMGDDV